MADWCGVVCRVLDGRLCTVPWHSIPAGRQACLLGINLLNLNLRVVLPSFQPEGVYELEKKVEEVEERSSDDHGTSSPPTHTSSLSSALLASMGASRGQQETSSRKRQREGKPNKASKELG